MTNSAKTPGAAPRGAATETTLAPLLVLSVVLLASWSVWALFVRPQIPRAPEPIETTIGIAARGTFWLVPCAIYLWRYWGARWHEPLGLDFPLGRAQVLRAAVVTLVVALLLLLGTATRRGLGVAELALRFIGSARFEFTAPLFEELVFRGLLLGELINWVRDSARTGIGLRIRFWGVLLFSAVVFVLVHWPWWLMHFGLTVTLERTLPVLVTGVVLGFVFAQTRSLWACVVLHWVNNQLSQLG